MADSYETLIERADVAAAAAARASLENVRERELRSEKVWRVLAEQETARRRACEAAQRAEAFASLPAAGET